MHTTNSSLLLALKDIDKTKQSLVGGKAANLGELFRIEGIRVPEGFCITTEVFKRVVAENNSVSELINQLSILKTNDQNKITEFGKSLRSIIEQISIPDDITNLIQQTLSQNNNQQSYAVRSSATAEDLPTASFAGQQDSYLNIIDHEDIIHYIRKCWASSFTDRAITYRIKNDFDHRKVHLAVIIQQLIIPEVSGIMFTADPISSNRKVISIDAGFGLGEALVSGLVNADVYKIQDEKIIERKISKKKIEIIAQPGGGTIEKSITNDQQEKQVLTDAQLLELEQIGRKIEKYFDHPQDIEWCLANDKFYIVQSRPITTLFPIPEIIDDKNHIYISVGHQQMMTDAMKPLGISIRQLNTRAPMFTAGGRMFIDVAGMLATAQGRDTLINVLGKSDPLIRGALLKLIERENFVDPRPKNKKDSSPPPLNYEAMSENDPQIVSDLIKNSRLAVEQLTENIRGKSGTTLLDVIKDDLQKLTKSFSDPKAFAAIMTGMNASSLLNDKMMEWLGEKKVADTLAQSAPNNITSEMGLALLDVADIIRPYPDVINYLKNTTNEQFLNELLKYRGGFESKNAIETYLNKFGMRCVGEIDITKTRWIEKPLVLVPIILSNIRNFEAGFAQRKFEQGLMESKKKEQELVAKLKNLPDAEQKIKETLELISLIRNFVGYREYPKYDMMCHYIIYKEALLKEAAKLVNENIIGSKEDIYYLKFEEIYELVKTKKTAAELIEKRKEEFKLYEKLNPPRVMTSDGEVVSGNYSTENMPANAIVGLPVSAGTIEGRARVITRIEDADLKEGDILITAFTDPSWTPLFVSIKALVTEVGGLMTHGAVIAREYGLPAVVGVENATRLIKDGQQVRVNGTDGYIEII